ncbi:sodium- and chloride-dependent GABA transporter 2 [Parasteatoda tepidariorum]|uniref:sodium- and chloride-dependent GABA transporter 2 n=1 Tax=Parasteatoda tepidariorum TaxID=114398 RepID=UPI001C7293B3|nr:sodium- and chloride-dependent GABA transporter 2 [Parasteatoda tepidariorum]XP_042907990.1 sodium- and chloride-dependent GABA transporter 2 [Parasteatoda tepidariorum]
MIETASKNTNGSFPVSSVCISNRKGTDVSVSLASSSENTVRDEHERGQWSGKLDFLFSVINYAVGLGNVWRFPYLCYENGGGAFLFPYLICLVLIAGPAFVQEVSIGQFLSLGGISIWKKLAPMFKGVGYASMMIVALYNIYFIVIVAWILLYLKSSFTSQLPWARCDGHWNTENCVNLKMNATLLNVTASVKDTSPVVEFWERYVLGITDGIHDMGSLRWELALYLFAAWVFTYFIIWKGLHQSGKIIYVTALFPYVILTILLIRGVTLEGATNGILYLVTPNWDKLTETKVWISAGTQVFFTFGIGFGSVINLGSYNKFHHNFYRDSILLCIVNPLTSFLAAIVIFSVLGYMANVQGIAVSEAVKSGPGLAFLTYPEVVLHLPLSPIWSVLFFMMLCVLGINSQFCTTEALVSSLVDEWPYYLTPRRKLFSFIVCFALFLLGLPMVTNGGMYLFQLMDFYSASGISLLFVVFFQTVAISWIYGTERLSKNINTMIGFHPGTFLKTGWKILIPLGTVGIFFFSIVDYSPLVYAQVYRYPWWGEMMGWLIALSSMIWIPGYIIYYIYTAQGTLKQRIQNGLTPVLDRDDNNPPSMVNIQLQENTYV